MNYQRLSVGRIKPIVAFGALLTLVGGTWLFVEWKEKQRRQELEAAFPKTERVLFQTMLTGSPQMWALLPDIGGRRTKHDLRLQTLSLSRRVQWAESENTSQRASLALLQTELETLRFNMVAKTVELGSVSQQLVMAERELQAVKSRKAATVLADYPGGRVDDDVIPAIAVPAVPEPLTPIGGQSQACADGRVAEGLRLPDRAINLGQRHEIDQLNARILAVGLEIPADLKPTGVAKLGNRAVETAQIKVNDWLKFRGLTLSSLDVTSACGDYLCADGILGAATKAALKQLACRDPDFWGSKRARAAGSKITHAENAN
jgi:hypothetical protein